MVPPLLSYSQFLKEIQRAIDFNDLRFRGNMIQPGMTISMAADVHSMTPQARDLVR